MSADAHAGETAQAVSVEVSGTLAVGAIVCARCGQGLPSLWDVCVNPIHTGADGSGAGRAICSTSLPARGWRRS